MTTLPADPDDDVIFGQLGDDILQGDGSIGPVESPHHLQCLP